VKGLGAVDRGLTVLSWVIAGALVVMLFVGPVLVADDKPSAETKSYSGGSGGQAGADDGKQIFSENCGGCHTLSAAGTTGTVGPELDGLGLEPEQVTAIVSSGSGVMPSFSGSLDQAQIDAVAQFVASSSVP
jgi:mono/diheme cytochrome c family protein